MDNHWFGVVSKTFIFMTYEHLTYVYTIIYIIIYYIIIIIVKINICISVFPVTFVINNNNYY